MLISLFLMTFGPAYAAGCKGPLTAGAANPLARPTRLTQLLATRGLSDLTVDDAAPGTLALLEPPDDGFDWNPHPLYARGPAKFFAWFSPDDIHEMARSRDYAFAVAEQLRASARRSRTWTVHDFVKTDVYNTARWLDDRHRLARDGIPVLATKEDLVGEARALGLKVKRLPRPYAYSRVNMNEMDGRAALIPPGEGVDSIFNSFQSNAGRLSSRFIEVSVDPGEVTADFALEPRDQRVSPAWKDVARRAFQQIREGNAAVNPLHQRAAVAWSTGGPVEDLDRTEPAGQTTVYQYELGPTDVIVTPGALAVADLPRANLRRFRKVIDLYGAQMVPLPEPHPRAGERHPRAIALKWFGPWEPVLPQRK